MRRKLLGCLGVVLLTAAGCGGTAIRATSPISIAEPWQKYTRVEVRTFNGAIDLQPGQVQDVTITGDKYATGATLAEAQQNLEQVEIYVGAASGRPDTLLVELRCPEAERQWNAGARLLIELPQSCPADVETSNGAIRVTRLEGDVVLRTRNGRIEVSNVNGPVRADSSNGAIEANDIAGKVEAHTSNGRITVRHVPEAELHTSNGAVAASDVSGSLSVRTSNGSIDASVAPPAGGHVYLETSNGGVHLNLPAALGADLRLVTRSHGWITAGLDENAFKATHRSRTRVEGSLNGGGCRVEAVTSNGSITLDTR